MSYTSTGGLPSLPRLAVAGVDQGAPESGLAGGLGGSASANTLTLPTQASAPAAPASGVVLYANSSGRLAWRSASDGFSRSIVVTATADRVFTMPDASLTVAGQNFANTFSVLQVFSANGALSAPAVSFTGTPITGGSSTTTKPMVLIETAGATSTGWSASGTLFGINSNGGAIFLFDFQSNGSSRFSLTGGGVATLASSGVFSWNGRASLSSPAAANLQLGAADAAAPVAQTLSVQSVVAGTTDTAGANWTLNGSRGTGTGNGGQIILQTAPPSTTGSSQNALVATLTLSNGGITFGPNTTTIQAVQALVWQNRGGFRSTADGAIKLENAAQNGFTSLSLGPDVAAPSAVSLNAGSVLAGTSNTAGALFTWRASLGTGLGDPGSTGRQTGIRGATGTTQQTAGWRDFISGKDTTLTEATATTLFTVTVGTGKYLGMIVECTVFASDGTDFQVLHSTLRINTGNKAGTLGVTGIMQTDCATPYNSSGTLTPVTYTLVDNGSGVLAVKCAATSSLVQTTLSCKYQITAINSSDAITITPA